MKIKTGYSIKKLFGCTRFSNRVAAIRKYNRAIAVVELPEGSRIENLPSYAVFNDGWNGSFHDCRYYNCFLACFGKNSKQAKMRVKELIEKNLKVEDVAAKKQFLRSLVRPGD